MQREVTQNTDSFRIKLEVLQRHPYQKGTALLSLAAGVYAQHIQAAVNRSNSYVLIFFSIHVVSTSGKPLLRTKDRLIIFY